MRTLMLFIIAASLIFIDQATKTYFLTTFINEGVSKSIIPEFLNWTLAYNYGAAFSFLGNHDGWQVWLFSGIAIIASISISIWIIRLKPHEKCLGYALAFILSGAIGNVIDRISNGRVTDFIHVFYKNYHFPIFNFADICISIGVVLIILSSMLDVKTKGNKL